MNYPIIAKILGRVMGLEAVLMIPSIITALWYGESTLWYIETAAIAAVLAVLLNLVKLKNRDFYAREGFVSVALSWVLMSAVGALPFVFSGEIPSYVDAFFEIVSGFTTTGATILTDVDAMSNGLLLWRSLSHWIGGMGVLVFIMAVMPMSEERSMYIMRAEVPGTSARMMYMLLSSLIGRTAMMNTSTPMPPIQCDRLRQSSSPLLMDSTSVSIVAPVVVKPETISKNAST